MQMPSSIGASPVGITKVHGPQGINAPHAPFRGQAAGEVGKTQSASDTVTISSAAEAALQATETSGIRQDVVSRLRAEIASGAYETPAKLDVALDRLLDQIG
jgi:negative regulator of flagellin synthesis FlgM